MSLKQLIKRERMLHPAVDAELELPGEPLIYSIKYPIASRTRSTQFFRNMQWKGLLKSFFRSYYRTSIPVVVIVRFYVSPPDNVNISYRDLAKEKTPAVFSHEVCDYLLSFLEMLHHVLVNSYKQIVKVDVEKYYSPKPRTVFKFMKWDEHVQLQNNNSLHTKTESISENRQIRKIQSEQQGNAADKGIREEDTKAEGSTRTSIDGTVASDSTLSPASSSKSVWKKTRSAKSTTSHKKARRGQSRKVPK